MAIYTVTFLSGDGTPLRQETIECSCDDDVIDTVGESLHPHSIDVHEGERHIARFPPWPL